MTKPDVLKDGEKVKVHVTMMDASAGGMAAFDAAGPSHLSDGTMMTMDAALAAAPVETADLQRKVHRALGDARNGYTADVRDAALRSLNEFAGAYAARALHHDGAARDACHKAAESISGAVTAMRSISGLAL